MFRKKAFAVVSDLDVLAGQISCSTELSMKNFFYNFGAWFQIDVEPSGSFHCTFVIICVLSLSH